LNNQDPQPGINYDYLSHQESLSVMWSPAGGKAVDFQGSYTRSDLRSDLRSDINYLQPSTESPLLPNYFYSTRFFEKPGDAARGLHAVFILRSRYFMLTDSL
jgi:hypothetical protein